MSLSEPHLVFFAIHLAPFYWLPHNPWSNASFFLKLLCLFAAVIRTIPSKFIYHVQLSKFLRLIMLIDLQHLPIIFCISLRPTNFSLLSFINPSWICYTIKPYSSYDWFLLPKILCFIFLVSPSTCTIRFIRLFGLFHFDGPCIWSSVLFKFPFYH
jgi:hypothetical protein